MDQGISRQKAPIINRVQTICSYPDGHNVPNLEGKIKIIEDQEIPPKTHNLIFLLKKTGIKPEDKHGRFLAKLNEASIVTRYPEDLDRLQGHYNESVTEGIISNSKEVLKWLKDQF